MFRGPVMCNAVKTGTNVMRFVDCSRSSALVCKLYLLPHVSKQKPLFFTERDIERRTQRDNKETLAMTVENSGASEKIAFKFKFKFL